MKKNIALQREILQSILDFFMEIKTGGEADNERLNSICTKIEHLLILEQDEESIDKNFLSHILSFPNNLRLEMPYLAEKVSMETKAVEIQSLTGLLLAREIKEDRKPGIPRII